MDSAPWKTRIAALGMVGLVATTAVACSSTNSSSTATTAAGSAGSSARTIPASAYSDHTGITSNSIRVGNVSTLAIGGLFKGALVGTQAYADYVNSQGGVNGRHIVVDSADDQYTGTGNKQATQAAVTNDAALVGGFSTFDSYGGAVLAKNPGVPDVTQVLDLADQRAAQCLQPGAPRGRVAGGCPPVLQDQVRERPVAEGGHPGRQPAVAGKGLGGGEVRDGEGRLQGDLRADLR